MLKIFKQNIKYFFVDYIEKIYIDIKKKLLFSFAFCPSVIGHSKSAPNLQSVFDIDCLNI